MTSFAAVLSAGAALGGVLAVAASWSRGARPGAVPHLSAGAVAAVGSAVALRVPHASLLVVLALAAALGAAAGWLLHRVQDELAGRAGDLAGLAGVAVAVALALPRSTGFEARSLLGGQWAAAEGLPAAWALLVLLGGVAAGVALAVAPAHALSLATRWTVAGAVTACLGAAAASGGSAATAFARPEAVGLALAAAAAAALSRTPLGAVGAGVALAAGVTLLEAVSVPGALTAAGVLVVALWRARATATAEATAS